MASTYIAVQLEPDGSRHVISVGYSKQYPTLQSFKTSLKDVDTGVSGASFYEIPSNVSLPTRRIAELGNTATLSGQGITFSDGTTATYGGSLNLSGTTAALVAGNETFFNDKFISPSNSRFNYRDVNRPNAGEISKLQVKSNRIRLKTFNYHNLPEDGDRVSQEFFSDLDPKAFDDINVESFKSILKLEAENDFLDDLNKTQSITFKRDDNSSTTATFNTDFDTQMELVILHEYSQLNQELINSTLPDSVTQTGVAVVDSAGTAYNLSVAEFERLTYEYFRKLFESYVPRVNLIESASGITANTAASRTTLLQLSFSDTKANPPSSGSASISGGGK